MPAVDAFMVHWARVRLNFSALAPSLYHLTGVGGDVVGTAASGAFCPAQAPRVLASAKAIIAFLIEFVADPAREHTPGANAHVKNGLPASAAPAAWRCWRLTPDPPFCDTNHSAGLPPGHGWVGSIGGDAMKKIMLYFALVFAVVAGTATVLTVVTPQSAIADACTSGNCQQN